MKVTWDDSSGEESTSLSENKQANFCLMGKQEDEVISLDQNSSYYDTCSSSDNDDLLDDNLGALYEELRDYFQELYAKYKEVKKKKLHDAKRKWFIEIKN